MTASDNDVYVKSMDGFIDELKQTCSQQQLCAKLGKATGGMGVGVGVGSHVMPPPPLPLPQIKTEEMPAAAANEPAGVASWGTSFERLLEDPAGLHTFAEFLKKEFSAENIYFWTACERFRHLDSEPERVAQARAIFAKHLANGSLEPVNVDSQARNLSEEKLQSGERDIFAPAQKQIFNLMKFDSYQRFIRSDLYKSCMEAEEKQQPLPYGADDLDELLRLNFQQGAASKLKKSASNAEDRRRKSLLPWHRKTRSKSRDRVECDVTKLSMPAHAQTTKLPQLSGNSLKIPSTQNSMSDIHSSRSSLSSFDALPAAMTQLSNGQGGESTCSLCRVILSDGATTIVQTRPSENVGQLVERLLEKRGLTYKFYDVVLNGCTKSIDLQSPSVSIAGKEVLIEQRVAFKIDLPDPKVISVKSKPKKQLHEVIRPILQKYNYDMDAVQVLVRDSHVQLDLSQPVTIADGLRLQIVLVRPPNGVNFQKELMANGCAVAKFARPALPKNVSFQAAAAAAAAAANGQTAGTNHSARSPSITSQSTLDEITNKVFNELLQGKVEAHATEKQLLKPSDLCSLKSDDCASETSSIFDRIRRRDSNIPGIKLKSKKKSTSSQHSEEASQSNHTANGNGNTNSNSNPNCNAMSTQPTIAASIDLKKPIIAKLKAGVKLQVTERVAENQDELLEGLKRAQLARLEDQRGTEINFELPDFLKNKEGLNVTASKLRKVRANLSPVSKTMASSNDEPTSPSPQTERPQPAPRLSITNKHKSSNLPISPMKIDEEAVTSAPPLSPGSLPTAAAQTVDSDYGANGKGPPPLPPKPKVLPIKPSNWGVSTTTTTAAASTSPTTTPLKMCGSTTAVSSGVALPLPSKIPIDITRKSADQASRCAYLEEPSSSFV